MAAMVRLVNFRPALLALPLLLLGAGALHADPIAQTVLDNSYNSCMQGCTSGGAHTKDKCDAYCSCSVSGVEEKFTAQEFNVVNTSTVAGKSLADQPIPQGSKDKLVAIVNACGPKLQ
jgi:hypothetical protein